MVESFFFGVADGSSKLAIENFAPRKFNIMINYASAKRPIPKNTDKLFVDSGGFSFFYKLREYPDGHLDYLRFVYKVKADFFANRDYPNEPQVRKKWGVTVRENQVKTIENQVQIMELMDNYYPKLRPKFVAVLQGWSLDDYLWMLDYMKEHGLLTKHIGLGTMCRRGQEQQIRKYILAIRKELPRKYKLHGFGIKFGVLKHKDVWDALYSADSLAYRYHIKKNWKENISIQEQITEVIKKWLYKLEELEKKHNSQLYWDEHWWELIPKFEEEGW